MFDRDLAGPVSDVLTSAAGSSLEPSLPDTILLKYTSKFPKILAWIVALLSCDCGFLDREKHDNL